MPQLPEILLVEDNPDERELFARALNASGLEATVTYATGAPEAVMRLNRMGKYAGTELPSLIILDLGLPGLKGLTLLQVIRNAYGPRHIPVVILTGSIRPEDKEACERWGIADYAIKPDTQFGLTQFVNSLARLLAPTEGSSGTIPTAKSPEEKDGKRP